MREVITQFLKGGKATMSSTVPYRANGFQDFNGVLSQIKNMMLTLLKQPMISENHVYEIASKTREPQRNTNAFNESTSNWHILLKYINFIGKGGYYCSKMQHCIGDKRSCFLNVFVISKHCIVGLPASLISKTT